MLATPTLDELYGLKLPAMAQAWFDQQKNADLVSLSFDERLGLLVDAEWLARENKRLARTLQEAKLKLPPGLHRGHRLPGPPRARQGGHPSAHRLPLEHQQVLVTGATGTGNSFIAYALAHQACRRGVLSDIRPPLKPLGRSASGFPHPFTQMKTTAFLSHSSADRIFVHRLAEELEASGVEVWLDEHQLRLGDWLTPSLRTALHESDYVIVVVSPDAVRSTWVEREISIAERHARRTGGKPVLIPVLLSQVPAAAVKRVVGDRLYADFRKEDGFFLALAKVLERMGLQQSFSSRLARLDEIEPVPMRTASLAEIQTGRDILVDLAHDPVLDVTEYRNWIIWELLRRVCRGKYPIEVVIRGGSRPHCRIFDDLLGRVVNVRLSESELAAGVWEFRAGGDHHPRSLSPSRRQRPKAKPEDVFTHLGLSGEPRRLENPWNLAGSERAQTRVVRSVLKKLDRAGPAMARSLLIDWQLIALGRHGHEMRIRWGSAIVPSSSKDGPFCVQARGPRHPRPGDRAGIIFLEIEIPFFKTTNALFVCRRHGSPRWQGAFNAMTTGDNAILPTYRAKVHPELYSWLMERERNA